MEASTHIGDCLEKMAELPDGSVDLIYLDPPFFTDKTHRLRPRDRAGEYSFQDLWASQLEYADFILQRLREMRRLLRDSGNIFAHCDRNAAHVMRIALDEVFGSEQQRAEIIWSYKRWSSSKKGLTPAHQNIYFYSRSRSFTFNTLFQDYSASTNVDQLLQKRVRDQTGKAVYARDEQGEPIPGKGKRGVPLGDVWEIPYLNPRAKERVGYPTQKPILLLERIIEIGSKPGDTVLDPFCGSGTTLVAAKLLGRRSIGIDTSNEAISLTRRRLEEPTKSESRLLRAGRETYLTADQAALRTLEGLDLIPVQRNRGVDAILKQQFEQAPVLVRVQRRGESLAAAAKLLSAAARKKKAKRAVLVVTEGNGQIDHQGVPARVTLVDSAAVAILRSLGRT